MPTSSLLTIRSLRVRPVELRPPRPMQTASGVLSTTPLVLLDVETEEGVIGSSYVRCYAPTALASLAALIAGLEDVVRGHDAAPFVVERTLHTHFRLLGPQGLTGIAIAALDMALWDARAKSCNVPLVVLLGGTPAPIPAYASLRSMDAAEAAREATEVLPLGFRAVKVKIGRGDLANDLAVVRAVRSAIGPDVALMVDYNQSLSLPEAVARGRALDNENIYWIEEPLRADDIAGHARVARATATAIQLGENWWGPHDAAKSMAAGASDHAMLDVMKLGGVSGWLRAAALAAASSLPVSSHAFPEFSVHLLGVTPGALWLEYLDHVGTLLQHPVQIVDGHAVTPHRPGAGIEWDEDAVGRAMHGMTP